ncbi:MAG TPA: DNA-directed RNA polymerase subunit omega [Methylomirabilota bacterium]|jgi:DNA-directed RNA polymerase omega subunit|nr:DNA-directed RNA polymerase subunit omega [Methylomirabilota bacterium]
MTVQNQAPDSKFAFVVVASRRARQLMAGAPPMVTTTRVHKPTRIAVEELKSGVLEFEAPESPGASEEKDAKKRKE